MENSRGSFGSKLGVILATAGSAVGLGNIWRFDCHHVLCGDRCFLLAVFRGYRCAHVCRQVVVRLVRLCHGAGVPACSRLPYLSVRRLVCAQEAGQGRVYQLGNIEGKSLLRLSVLGAFCVPSTHPFGIPQSVGTSRRHSVRG